MKENKIIWLFGENESRTANNNSYYMWDQVVEYNDEILKYFILKKSKENKKIIKNISEEKRKFIIWKNSFKHWRLIKLASMGFVSLSYKDILPEKLLFLKTKLGANLPIIYLQHGTLGIKKLGYTGHSYKNNMFRFVIYNEKMLNKFEHENNFKPYQLYYLGVHPRYKKLVEISNSIEKEEQKQILFFTTWREYFGDNEQTAKLISCYKKLFSDKRLNKFLEDNNYKIKLCLHQFFSEKAKKDIVGNLKNVEVVCPKDVDVMYEIAKSDILITDYSSLGYDFTFLNKPVLLYQPDLNTYLQYRKTYCDIQHLKKYSIQSHKKLVDTIIKKEFNINNFFKEGTPSNINYDDVLKGKHIEKFYEDMKKVQLNSIAFIGYNFYGKGGTVSATKSLAEALLEKGYLVRLFSLKKTRNPNLNMPSGLNSRGAYEGGSRRKKELLKRLLRFRKYYSYIKYDCNKKYLIPYAGLALKKYLDRTTCKTVVSTRESLHILLNKCGNENIKNKVYFFHTDANVIDVMYPGLMPELKNIKLDKCAFVTKKNYDAYIEKYKMTNVSKYEIVGNTLQSSNMVNIDDIKLESPSKIFTGISLIRMSNDRKEDIEKIIEFGRYLKNKKISKIKIDVFGMGVLAQYFEEKIKEEQLDEYIIYKGGTDIPHSEIRKHDYVVDFALNQSFGMTYIEAIFNGKKIFATKNSGSMEVLKDIPNSYYENFDELVKLIYSIKNISQKELKENYKKISQKYSRECVANKLENLIND